MNNIYPILLVVEVLLALAGAWCILNEKKLIVFEERLARRIRAAVRMYVKKKSAEKRRRINARVRYTPITPKRGIASGREAA